MTFRKYVALCAVLMVGANGRRVAIASGASIDAQSSDAPHVHSVRVGSEAAVEISPEGQLDPAAVAAALMRKTTTGEGVDLVRRAGERVEETTLTNREAVTSHMAVAATSIDKMYGEEMASSDMSSTAVPAGCTEENAPETKRHYSSVYGNQAPGVGHARSTLDGPQGWSAAINNADQWVQIDLGKTLRVTGTMMQGRKNVNQWVTKVTVETSVDGGTFVKQGGTYKANSDQSTKVFVAFPSAVVARFVRIIPVTWHGHISMRAGAVSCGDAPTDFGAAITCGHVENTPDSSRYFSSVYGNDKKGGGHANAVLDSPLAWCTATSALGEWMYIDLGKPTMTTGVQVQGRPAYNQFVTKMKLYTSMDGKTWTQQGAEYSASTDMHTKVTLNFPSKVEARYVRFNPTSWSVHICMRAGVVTCTSGKPTDPVMCGGSVMNVVNRDDAARSYSSIWKNCPDCAKSQLDSKLGWCALTNTIGAQWLQMDLGQKMTIQGLVTQGRADADQWVVYYTVETSLDGRSFTRVSGVFPGNTDRNTKVQAVFRNAVDARYVRIKPQKFRSHMSMRAGVLACPLRCAGDACKSMAMTGEMTSNSKYANMQDASFTVTGPAVVKFTTFDVEADETCRWDYIELAGKKYCGDKGPPQTAVAAGHTVVMKWHSDFSSPGVLDGWSFTTTGAA